MYVCYAESIKNDQKQFKVLKIDSNIGTLFVKEMQFRIFPFKELCQVTLSIR